MSPLEITTVTCRDPGPSLCLEEATTMGSFRPQAILHVCTRYADHGPAHKHICSCQFTWGAGE